MSADHDTLAAALSARFGEAIPVPENTALDALAPLAARGSSRVFDGRPVDGGLIRVLCAVALCAPTKSDLQQRDVVVVQDPALRNQINTLVGGQEWVASAPSLLIFCGNNRRQRQLHQWRGIPFANDHLDAFFNAAVDAGIALSAFVLAAEAVGLSCCPISAVRNEAQAVSELLGLPDHVFPVAGLALGYAVEPPEVSMRLPLNVTLHTDRFNETGLREAVESYDAIREAAQPFKAQRAKDRFGCSDKYGWSQDKARQYGLPERADFGEFVRRKGFSLD